MHFHVHRNRICSICDTMMLPSSSSSGSALPFALKMAFYYLLSPGWQLQLLTFFVLWHFIDNARLQLPAQYYDRSLTFRSSHKK